jgi:hypothetical protein
LHAIYAEYEAQVVIETLELYGGELPAHELRLVREWAEIHRAELEANWARVGGAPALDTLSTRR